MADGYSWNASRSGGAYHLPGPDRLGWWAAVAMLLSILLHVMVFFWLDDMKIAFKFEEAKELSTRPIATQQTKFDPVQPEQTLPPEEVVKPPTDSSTLLEDVELLDILPKDQEIDIKPKILEAEYALREQNPAREGTPDAVALEISDGMELDADLPELGRQPESIKPAEIGQITVDPGEVHSDDTQTSQFLEDAIKQGANGKVENGSLDGMISLENMLNLPSNVLLGKKTMLPSDLLFEFNRAELRESAKVGLMKLTLLIDKNPNLYCWIEGHTDLVGGDEFNLKLSIQRAEAVKSYLVSSLRMDASKIYTRGFGRYQPIVTSGTAEEQAANRRVEISMRKTPPTKEQMQIAPPKPAVIEEAPSPKAILVKPMRALPIEETPAPPVTSPAPPRAAPVRESPAPPRAAPVQESPAAPRATPVPEMPAPLKATPVEEPPPLRAEPAFEEIPRAQEIDDEE